MAIYIGCKNCVRQIHTAKIIRDQFFDGSILSKTISIPKFPLHTGIRSSGTTILKLKAQESLTVILETLINRNLRLNRGKG